MLKILTVAGLATFQIYAAIPAGFALGLSPFAILIATIVGGLSSVLLTAFFGKKLHLLLSRKQRSKKSQSQTGIGYRIWKKYGTVGLGLLGTMAIGGPASIAIGLGCNASLKRLLAWCCIGVTVRCLLFTLIGHYSAQMF